MVNTAHLNAAAQYHCTSSLSTRELKNHLKTTYQIDARRLSRLSMLALAGAMPLASHAHPHTAIHTAANFGSPSVYQSMMDNVFDQNIAKPFDLLAHLHNAPAFHVAAELGSSGATIFQAIASTGTAWQLPLRCAINDIAAGANPHILLGWCYESSPSSPQQEGSIWVALSNQPSANSVPLSLSDGLATATETHYLQQVQTWLQSLATHLL